MTETKTILNYMEENQAEFLKILKEVVTLQSPTEGSKEDVEKCKDYFENLFTSIGFKCKTVPSNDERYGDHLLMELGEGEEQILFVGHYDTVYEKDTFGKSWEQRGEKIYGPGILDMKGGNVQVYMVAKALKSLGLLPANKKLVFFLSSDEEAGSGTSHMHYEALAKRSKASFVMEPALSDDINHFTIGRYSRGNYTIVAEGSSAHSGREPEVAESGLIELAKQAIYLENLTDLEKGVTIACTSLQSGDAGWPTVPGSGELTIDARFSSAKLAEEYNELIKNLKSNNPNVKLTTKGGLEKPVFDYQDPIHKNLFEIAKEVGKEFDLDLKGGISRGGSDGNFTASVGCPTLDGMGMTGAHLHQPGKEYMSPNDVARRGAFVAHMVLEVFNNNQI